MNETLIKLQILARAEMTLAKVNARRLLVKTVYVTLAVVFLLLTLAMLNVAFYFVLHDIYGSTTSALLVATANALLAGLLLFLMSRIKPGVDEKLVRDIREMALKEISADMDEAKEDFDEAVGIIKDVGGLLSGGARSLTAWAGLAPVLGMLLGKLKSTKTSKPIK